MNEKFSNKYIYSSSVYNITVKKQFKTKIRLYFNLVKLLFKNPRQLKLIFNFFRDFGDKSWTLNTHYLTQIKKGEVKWKILKMGKKSGTSE